MSQTLQSVCRCALLVLCGAMGQCIAASRASALESAANQPWYFSSGFEDALNSPWGTGQNFQQATAWWNSGACKSTAAIDWRIRRNGWYSLKIENPTPRGANVYGTTQQPLKFRQGHRYRVEVWAVGHNLASNGAVSLVVDMPWKMRPVQLPRGSFDWKPFRGEFVWPGGEGQCRILSEDRGTVWLDDISIVDLGPDSLRPTPSESESITAAVLRFRQLALTDIAQAVSVYSTPAARQRFDQFDRDVLDGLDPATAWSYFFNTALIAAPEQNSSHLVVGLYNPWCDTVLLTVWQQGPRFASILDAELVAGDWLRTRGKFAKDPQPGWLRGNYVPVALAKTTAATVAAVETTFAGATAADWRERLPGLADRAFIDKLDYPYVGVLIAEALQQVDTFYVPRDGEDARLKGLRKETTAALKLAAGGDLDKLLKQAGKTSPSAATILRATPPREFRQLVVVGFRMAQDASMVFLEPKDQPDYCLCLILAPPEPRTLFKIEVVSYAAAYKKWKEEQSAAPAADRR